MNITVLITALIIVESKGDSKKVNGDSVGILQLSPSFVQEVNHILGLDLFVPDDRFRDERSIRMLLIWFSHYKGRFFERIGEPITYQDACLIYHYGFDGFWDKVPYLDKDEYWLKVEKVLSNLKSHISI